MDRGLPFEETTRRNPDRDEFVLKLPSDLRMIEAAVTHLVDRCRAFAYEGPRLSLNLRVGITEALANAMIYGNASDPAKHVRLQASIDPVRVCAYVEDEGSGFDPDLVPDPTLPENLQRAGGRGIFLIRNLMDEVEFNARGNGIRMVLLREPRR